MALCDLLEATPDKTWPAKWVFSFRNPFKMYGSPWFDGAWHEATGQGNPRAVAALLKDLRAVNVPMAAGRGGRGGRRAAAAAEGAELVQAVAVAAEGMDLAAMPPPPPFDGLQ